MASPFILLGGKNCLQPEQTRRAVEAAGLSAHHWYGLPNSFCWTAGKAPGRGWVLMQRSYVDSLNLNSALTLKFSDGSHGVSLQNLRVVSARTLYNDKITPHANTAVLIELVDKRALLAMSTVQDQYNVRWPTHKKAIDGYDGGYYGDSLNGSSPWTFDEILADLWNKLPSGAAVGSAPTTGISTTPHNLKWFGCSAWDAVHDLCQTEQVLLLYNPITDDFSTVLAGTSQAGLATAIFALETDGRTLDQDAPIFSGSGTPLTPYLPEKIRVHFVKEHHRIRLHPEVPTPDASDDPYTSVDIATGAAGAVAGTIINLWDNLPAKTVNSGSSAIDNQSELNDRAALVAGNYTNALTNSHFTPSRIVVSGIADDSDIACGTDLHLITYRALGDPRGMITELRRNSGQLTHPSFFQNLAALAGSPHGGGSSTTGQGGSFPGFGSCLQPTGLLDSSSPDFLAFSPRPPLFHQDADEPAEFYGILTSELADDYNTESATVELQLAWNGKTPLGGTPSPSITEITVLNVIDYAGFGPGDYVFASPVDATCRVEYDRDNHVYRFLWIQC